MPWPPAPPAICLDILKNEWSPALSLKTALLSLQALLSTPEPDDPQDAVVAGLYKSNHAEFVKTAKFWTETYAMPKVRRRRLWQAPPVDADDPSRPASRGAARADRRTGAGGPEAVAAAGDGL